jgi:hypothetical protein
MNGFIDTFFNNQLQQLTIHNCIRLAPSLTGLRVSSLLLWLTWFWFTNRSFHQLPFCRCPLVNTPQLNTQLNSTTELWNLLWVLNAEWQLIYGWIANECVLACHSFITSGRTEYKSSPPIVPLLLCLLIRCCGKVFSEQLSSNGRLCSVSLTAQFRLSDSHERWDRGFKSHSRHGCLCAFILCLLCSVCRQRPCGGLIPRLRSPIHYVYN